MTAAVSNSSIRARAAATISETGVIAIPHILLPLRARLTVARPSPPALNTTCIAHQGQARATVSRIFECFLPPHTLFPALRLTLCKVTAKLNVTISGAI
jgi:hypothetical protein